MWSSIIKWKGASYHKSGFTKCLKLCTTRIDGNLHYYLPYVSLWNFYKKGWCQKGEYKKIFNAFRIFDFSIARMYHLIQELTLLLSHLVILIFRTKSVFNAAALWVYNSWNIKIQKNKILIFFYKIQVWRRK